MSKELLDYLVKRIDSIDSKVDEMLKFKWQIIGGSVVASTVISVLITIAIAIYTK